MIRRILHAKAEILGMTTAVVLLASQFGWWHWTDGQTEAVFAVIGAAFVLVARLDRERADLLELDPGRNRGRVQLRAKGQP